MLTLSFVLITAATLMGTLTLLDAIFGDEEDDFEDEDLESK